MNKPTCFIELCAGTAALSIRLQGGKGAKPPVSRMGAKTGYADVILSVLGLYPGLGAESYVWCEPDDGVRGLLMAYCQPSVLQEAAAILRGWKDEEPRALWERLRAELKAGASVDGAKGVARYILVIGQTWPHKMDGRPMSQWAQKTKDDGGVCIATLIEQAQSMPSLPPTFIARDGRAVTPEEVAKWIYVGHLSYRSMEPESGFNPGMDHDTNSPCWRPPVQAVADVMTGIGSNKWPPVTITDDAKTITPNKLPEGVIVYCDPPYLNTTGYKHDLPREEVIRLARLWSDAGATVCISEQTTIPELISDGWHGVQISFARKGQKRTFSDQQDEYLTINRKPHFIPREPEPMFEDLKVVKKPRVKVVRVSQPEPTVTQETKPVQTLDLFGNTNND